MRRIEPAFPDLLPVTHRLGWVPAGRSSLRLDPVEMRLCRGDGLEGESLSLPGSSHRRPARVLIHAGIARRQVEAVADLVRTGSGILLVLDEILPPETFPKPLLRGQTTVVSPWWPPFWGGETPPDLEPWARAGHRCGILLGVAPAPDVLTQVHKVVAEAAVSGASFTVVAPLAVSPEIRHRVYDLHAGENGDPELENLLFHSDWARLTQQAEVVVSRSSSQYGLTEGLAGPGTALASADTFTLASGMFLWARRLDQLEGVASQGWQLRRAAHALLAAGREAGDLVEEDNLRLIPGFNPWVEALARALWVGEGHPLGEIRERWLCN
jgi:hypothetical protein